MLYEQFVEEIESQLKLLAGERIRICLHTAVKNNGKCRKGVTFSEKGVNLSPTIYLEEYYERLTETNGVEKTARQLMSLYEEVKLRHSWEGEFVQSYENVRGRIIYQLINRGANKELLKEVPHVPYLNLAIIFCVLVELEERDDRMVTMTVKKEHLSRWGTTEEEIYREARENTERLLPCEFSSMYAVIEEMFGIASPYGEEGGEEAMYILSNSIRNYGASALLYEERLERIGLYLQENFFVLPSSIHEVILVPESKAPSLKELSDIVYEMNHTQVEAEEVLSDRAYYYDRKKKELSL